MFLGLDLYSNKLINIMLIEYIYVQKIKLGILFVFYNHLQQRLKVIEVSVSTVSGEKTVINTRMKT